MATPQDSVSFLPAQVCTCNSMCMHVHVVCRTSGDRVDVELWRLDGHPRGGRFKHVLKVTCVATHIRGGASHVKPDELQGLWVHALPAGGAGVPDIATGRA